MKSRKSSVSIGFIPLNPVFQCSIIPVFPPGRRPYGPEANWGETPNLINIYELPWVGKPKESLNINLHDEFAE